MGIALEVLGAILVSFVLVAGKPPPENCVRNWEKVGCFQDHINGPQGRVYPYELVNHRDPTNSNWDGHTLDWNEWPKSLHALACKCASMAKKMNYQFFGLQFYGECWSGPSPKFFRDGVAKTCVGDDYKKCNNSAVTECVGEAFTNYIYKIIEAAPDVAVDGAWTEWTAWTKCTVSCNGGKRTRERSCTNPEPSNGGKECVGDATISVICNMEKCELECKSQMEIGIILDASTSVTRRNWDKTLKFVQKFSDDFKIGPNNVHFGIIRFSWFPTLKFAISDKRYWSKNSFKQEVSKIRYTYGGTRTDLAIEMAENDMFCFKCKLRPRVPRALIVLTDGKASREATPMSKVTAQLKENGVKIIAIGIGSGVDADELSQIATDENHVLVLNGYRYIDDPINKLVKLTCVRK